MGKGYRREPKAFLLKFEDADMEGLEVRAQSVSVEKFLEITELAALATEKPAEAVAGNRKLLELFVGALDSWNLEDFETEQPVKTTFEEIAKQEFGFILQIIIAWQEAMASVSAPLPKGSNGGATSLEQSIPMEAP